MNIPSLPPKIKLDNLRRAIAGSRGFVSSRQYDALKKSGLGDLRYASGSKIIGKDRAGRAIQVLKKANELGSRPGSSVWQKAVGLERDQMIKRETMKRGNIQAALAMDVDEQMAYEAINKNIYTKRTFSSINEKMQFEKEVRERKISDFEKKRTDLINAGVNRKSTRLPDFPVK